MESFYKNQYQRPLPNTTEPLMQPGTYDSRFFIPPVVPPFGYYVPQQTTFYLPSNAQLSMQQPPDSNQFIGPISNGYHGKKHNNFESGLKRKFEQPRPNSYTGIGKKVQESKSNDTITPYNNVNAATIDPNRHPCKLCLRSFKTDGGLVAHMKIVHPFVSETASTSVELTSLVPVINSDEKLASSDADCSILNCNHQCVCCKKTFVTDESRLTNAAENNTILELSSTQLAVAEMSQKLLKQNAKAYGCKICGKTKPSLTGLQHHILVKHPQVFAPFILKPTTAEQSSSSEALEKSAEDISDDNIEVSNELNDASQQSQEEFQPLCDGINTIKDVDKIPDALPTGVFFNLDSNAEETNIVEVVDMDMSDSADLKIQEEYLQGRKDFLKELIMQGSFVQPTSFDTIEKNNEKNENFDAANQLLSDVSKSVGNIIGEISVPIISTETSAVKDNKYSTTVRFDGAAFPCSKCKKMCKSSIALHQHCLSKHGIDSILFSEEPNVAVSEVVSSPSAVEGLQCPHCEKKIKNEAGLHQHIMMKHH